MGANLQQFGPFHNPHTHEFRPGNKVIHQLGSFVRRLVGHKRLHCFGGRQHADNIEIGSANKSVVITHFTRGDANLFELVVHEGVDVVSLGFIGEFEVRHLRNHQHLCAHSDLIEPRHHKRLTTCAGCHHTLTIHRSGDVIVSEEHGFVSHVARGAIAVHSSHDDLLLGAFPLEHGLFRVNLEVQHLGSACWITWRTGF